MKLLLCDLCGHGFLEDTSSKITIMKTNGSTSPIEKEICSDCAELIEGFITETARRGQVKRDQIVHSAFGDMDSLF